jgi:hypothetical protein
MTTNKPIQEMAAGAAMEASNLEMFKSKPTSKAR